MNIGRTIKYYLLKFVRLRGTPHSLALGAAIGIFVGITPTVPFHTVAILALTLPTRSSTIAGIITSWLVCNPLTYIPQYYLSLKIGNFVTVYDLSWRQIRDVLDVVFSDASLPLRLQALMTLGFESVIVMLVGGVLLALPFAVIGYYVSYFMFVNFRNKRREKQVLS